MQDDPTQIGAPGSSENDDVEEVKAESEVEKLESQVKEMAETILDYRTNLSHNLTSSLASLLSSHRPPFHSSSDILASSTVHSHQGSQDAAKSSEPATLSESDKKTSENIHLLREKISSNIALMPIVLKRMREIMSRMDKLDSSDEVINPAFKRKKTR